MKNLLLFAILFLESFFTHIPKKVATREGVYQGPIIDMHIHAYEQSPMFGMTHPPTLRGETHESVSNGEALKQEVLARFKAHNIVKAVVTSGHLWYEDAPETILIGQSRLDSLKSQFDKGKLHAIAELSPFYSGILADDPSLSDFFATAEELGVPVGFHIFPGGPNYGIRIMPRMLGQMRVTNAHPQQLEQILVQYPKLKIYIMHGGWPFVDEVKAMMYMYPNLYVDLAVINWILPQQEFNTYVKSLINSGFGNRMMHGSDQMVWPQLISVGIETVNNADFLTREQKEDIFYDNAATFLGLSKQEIQNHKNIYHE